MSDNPMTDAHYTKADLEECAEQVRESIVSEARRGNGWRSLTAILTFLCVISWFWCLAKVREQVAELRGKVLVEHARVLERHDKTIWELYERISDVEDQQSIIKGSRYIIRWVPKEGGPGHFELIDRYWPNLTPRIIEIPPHTQGWIESEIVGE